MDWTIGLIILAGVTGLLAWQRLSLVGAAAARNHLRQGARLIDVRSAAEFRERHLPGAINMPLNELAERIQREVPDKGQVLLLHCLSGGRSGMARRVLRQMGYQNAFNLGGYRRAARLVEKAG